MGLGTEMRRAAAIGCAVALAFGGFAAVQAPQARAKAVKAPAKVKVKSVKRAGDTVTVKVERAKGAKRYQYKVTIGGRSWKKSSVKTAARVKVGSARAGKVRVRARAESGSKKAWGKWSRAVKVAAAGAGASGGSSSLGRPSVIDCGLIVESAASETGALYACLKPVSGATGYEYQVSDTEAFKKIVATARDAENEHVFSGLASVEGLYVRARAVSRTAKGGWSDAAWAFRMDSDYKTVTDDDVRAARLPAPKYSYKVRLLSQPMASASDITAGRDVHAYVETDNPNPYFTVWAKCLTGSKKQSPSSFYLADSSSADDAAWRVAGGYLINLGFPGNAGDKVELDVTEGTPDPAAESPYLLSTSSSAKKLGTVTVGDYDAVMNAWMDSVIEEAVTDKNAPKGDQAEEIAGWLRDHNYYWLPADITPAQRVLVSGPSDAFLGMRASGRFSMRSNGSGWLMCRFGERLGYPLVNLWGYYDGNKRCKDPTYAGVNSPAGYSSLEDPDGGAASWMNYHSLAYSERDNRWFYCLGGGKPRSSQLASFDPATYRYFYDLR